MSDRRLNDAHPSLNPERWGWYTVGVTTTLVVLNLAIALASNSLVVGAEAFHNLVDLITSIAVLVGLKFATRKSRVFPYGLYKLENFLAVLLALMIFYTAYEFVHDAVAQPGGETIIQAWMYGGLALVMAIPLVYSHYLLKTGRRANSPALIATAKEFRTHVFTTGIVFISLVSAKTNLPIEQIGVVLIALVIIKTGWELLSEGILSLLDASLPRELLDRIQALIAAEPAVAEVRWISGRNAGRVRFVEAGVVLNMRDPEKLIAIPQKIENHIRGTIPFVERVLIHVETEPLTHRRYAVALEDGSGALSEHFSRAPYFAFADLDLHDLRFEDRQIVENPCISEEKARGIRVAEWLAARNVNVVLTNSPRQGKGPGYVMKNAGIEELNVEAATLTDALDMVLAIEESKRLPPTEP